MTRYAVGLGSNEGDRLAYLRLGARRIGEIGPVTASGLYESAPVGGPQQDPFLNAVVALETDLEPGELLDRLQRVENAAGRERKVRWGPRTLDLDILAWDGEPIGDAGLTIPHPRLTEREFALRPLTEIWPEAEVAPGLTAARGLGEVGDQEVDLLTRAWMTESLPWAGRILVTAQFVWFLGIAVLMAWDGSLPGGSPSATRITGAVLTVVGAILAFISSRRLGPALTALPEPRTAVALIESGPYALARHPIYGGVTLFILGAAMIVDSLAGSLLSLGLVPFFYVKSEYEERRLRMKYAGYRSYRQRVTRRLIPFVI